MALTEFQLFPNLPVELRREIYLLATPPRFVCLEEHTEGYRAFRRRLRDPSNQVTLDPSLAYFSCYWRQDIKWRYPCHYFERAGVVEPWELSPSIPNICHHCLRDNPNDAWRFMRESYLYSEAPIPALLHTCSESRDELLRKGYQLAFRTRSYGPRTWFNYDRDILFLRRTPEEYETSFITCCRWSFDQLHPDDMQRVRRLALEESHTELGHLHPGDANFKSCWWSLVSPIKLFRNIDELFLEGCHGSRVIQMDQVYATKHLQAGTDIAQSDILLGAFPQESIYFCGSFLRHELFVNGLKREIGNIEHVLSYLEANLTEYRARDVSNGSIDPASCWKIPKIKPIYLMSPEAQKWLESKRMKALLRLHEERKKWADVIKARKARRERHLTESQQGPMDKMTKDELDYLDKNTELRQMCLESDLFPWLDD
ncbi:hypothetical protein F66182_4729 [Fusarium sp. NRRL 66182]|nr:hypothetical protein F66182_4729 [Fusarium sp. NRRL 66182]